MFAADHTRQWKTYQRKLRDIDVRLTQWRLRATQTQENAEQQAALEEELSSELAAPLNSEAFETFVSALEQEGLREDLKEKYDALSSDAGPPEARAALRASLIASMERILNRARFEEDRLLSQRKFKSADYDEKRAVYDLAIRDAKPQAELDRLQEDVDAEREARDLLTREYQAAADHRKQLESSMRKMTDSANAIRKQLADLQGDYDRLTTSLEERRASYFTAQPPFLGKKWLELPILDAFNAPLKINNLWTENLTIPNGSFGAVRRFDRCTTCHQAIDRTAPGSAIDPLYHDAKVVEYHLPTPEERPKAVTDEEVRRGRPA
jgi:chromosome segregation ATPase